jgi:hypothetical protein
MKFLLSFLISFSLFSANAQTETTLPVDESGKFIQYEVVNSTSKPELLQARANDFIKKKSKTLKLKKSQSDTIMMANGKFVINKTLLVMSRPSGEVIYDFQVEIKEGKYRFWLTDFKFIPYMRDRYGNFVASTTVGVPLENNPGKLNASEWAAYKTQTFKFAKEFAVEFKNEMANTTPTTTKPVEKKVVKKEW